MNIIFRRKYAMEFCQMHGYKLFVDRLIEDKVVVLEDEVEPIKIDVTNTRPVVIMQNGKVIYTELTD